MQFTYESYAAMLQNLRDKGYQFKRYGNWQEADHTVILRHDVDNSLRKAVQLSEIEREVCPEGADATYFVLVSTDFYNIHSKFSRECIHRIIQNGGSIGLHFDETQYSISNEQEMQERVYKEIEILSDLVGRKVDVVSMHRPSEKFLSANIEFSGIINSYNETYFKKMKYVSDSRRHWRENVDEIIENAFYPRLHILTHPFWYRKGEEWDLPKTLRNAMAAASLDYYDNLNDNFRDLETEITRAEIEKIIFGGENA